MFQISDKIGMGIAGITADASNITYIHTCIHTHTNANQKYES